MIKEMELSQNWKLYGCFSDEYDIKSICSDEYRCDGWYDVSVPGDVHTELIKNKIIENPMYGYNDARCGWVEKKVWIYRNEFIVDSEILKEEHQELLFEGLDTYATVYLNGNKLADFQNMFVEHRAEVTHILKAGKNILTIEFHVLSQMANKWLPDGFWINYSTERAYARKAGYSFGWDWCPRIATIGIWKPVKVIAFSKAKLTSVQIKTAKIEKSGLSACLEFHLSTEMLSDVNVTYRICVADEEGKKITLETSERCFSISMSNVHLWWTADLGTPYLYRISVEMLYSGTVLDQFTCSYGIRDLQVQQKVEDGSHRFIFVLNGVELFARGTNWVPVSSFPSGAKDVTYTRLLNLAHDAGMNMLCLWGGGIYEKDIFYDTCDRLGILVWQYFMFACGEYPDFDPAFTSEVQDEITKVVIRLRNHPSIASWVGNVEGQLLSEKIGLAREMYGKKLFEEKIPQWLETLDDTRLYMPSSPYGGKTANDMDKGDRHNWDVWFNDVPFTEYSKDTTTFASEYGIQASPVRATLEEYLQTSDIKLDSYAFNYLNKDQSLDRMYYLMGQHAQRPHNLDEYIDYSMYVQAEGLKFGTEHYRRRFPKTGGSLIWQLNDCCPCQSWSLIDYDLIPKAAYYYAKHFFAPVLISLEEIDQTATGIWIVNNSRNIYTEKLSIKVRDYFGNTYYEEELGVTVDALSCKKIKEIVTGGRYFPNVIIPNRQRHFYITVSSGNRHEENYRFFGQMAEVPFPQTELSAKFENGNLCIASTCFARFVKIDGELKDVYLNDNYFNIEANSSRCIAIKTLSGKPLSDRSLYVKALNSKPYKLEF